MLFVRACAPEAAFGLPDPGAAHYPGLYLAGTYNHAERTVNGEAVRIASLVNLPHPFGLSWRVEDGRAEGGGWFAPDGGAALRHYRHRLDLATGVAERALRVRDADGRETQLLETRFVSQADPGLALLRWRLTPIDWSGEIVVRARLHTAPRNAKLERTRAYEGRHLDVQPQDTTRGVAVLATTTDGRRRVRVQAALRCAAPADGAAPRTNGDRSSPSVERGREDDALFQQCRLQVQAGVSVEAVLWVRVTPEAEAEEDPDPEAALAAHRTAWQALWSQVPVSAPLDADLERSCRFKAFHLLQAASPLSCARASGLPARGWQEGYFGHVFWDELFAFPFFSLRLPDVARSLLEYRWRRLDAALAAARRAGHRGALYPWRSAATGEEETPRFQWIAPARQWKADHTHLQHHIGAAIAFNLWQHHLATGDQALLLGHTGRVLIEIARFWASRAEPSAGGRFALRGVIGPDEYHDAYPGRDRPGLDNNAYTNLMAAWTLHCAAALRERLTAADWRRLAEQAGVQPHEPDDWDRLACSVELPLCEGDVIAQFEGFDKLLPVDALPLGEDERGQRKDWALAARGDNVNRYQVTKQADVLMLFHLLGHSGVDALVDRLGRQLSEGWRQRTVDHYLARVSHESGLSHIACAGALAECDREASWRYFRRALHTDLGPGASDSTHEGVHLGAMAGCWDVLQRFYLGLRPAWDHVAIEPHPPDALDDVSMAVWVRGARLSLHLQGRHLALALDAAAPAPMALRHGGEPLSLAPGGLVRLACR